VHPGVRLRQHAQRLDEIDARLRRAMAQRLGQQRAQSAQLETSLRAASPVTRVAAAGIRLEADLRALRAAARQSLAASRRRLDVATRTLQAVSPLATLARGYAIVTDAEGHVLMDATEVPAGTSIEARLARGRLSATVSTTRPAEDTDTPASHGAREE
jgi:exodeoxyribonuclease VII large subunit